MFGSSQTFAFADSQATPAPKRAREGDNQTCIPVTVRILQDAVARHADSQQVLIHGVEASIVHLVGVVEALVSQSAMIEFQVNDATGRMKVRYYTTGGIAPEGLVAGGYVSIVGNLRTAPMGHVSAMSLTAMKSGDDVSYHMIEVAHAALRLRNPKPAASFHISATADSTMTPVKQMGLGLGASNTLSPTKADAPAPFPSAVAMQTPVKVDLRSAVTDVLRQVQDTAGEEGTSISDLIARLPAAEATTQKVTEILAVLVEEGDVFTTIDDNHFQII
jgi:hypothetical protein